MSKGIHHFRPGVSILSCFLLLAIACKDTSKKGTVKRTETLVYHVHGLAMPDKECIERCKALHVRIKTESCIIDTALAAKNRYVDSVVKAEYGISVLEVLAQ